MIDFTLNDLSEFMKHEAQFKDEMLGLLNERSEGLEQSSIDNVLSYSKAYCSRKSMILDELSCILN